MRNLSIVSIVLFAYGHAAAQAVPDSPSRIWTQGSVLQGSVFDARFILRNTGDQPLVVESIQPSCGCTVVQPPGPVPPGGEREVVARVDTTEFTGPKTIDVAIRHNGAGPNPWLFSIQFNATPFFEVLPIPGSTLILGIHGPRSAQFRLVSHGPKRFRLTGIQVLAGEVKVETVPAANTPVAPAEGYAINLYFPGDRPGNAHIVFLTDQGAKPKYNLRFAYEFRPPVFAEPEAVSMVLAGPPSVGELLEDWNSGNLQLSKASVVRILEFTGGNFRVQPQEGQGSEWIPARLVEVKNQGYVAAIVLKTIDGRPLKVDGMDIPGVFDLRWLPSSIPGEVRGTLSYIGPYVERPEQFALRFWFQDSEAPELVVPVTVNRIQPAQIMKSDKRRGDMIQGTKPPRR